MMIGERSSDATKLNIHRKSSAVDFVAPMLIAQT